MNKPGQSGAKAPALYQGFNGQYIDGSWRPGKHGGVRVDTDPYSGATLAETVMANQRDLDEAYHAAAKAQVSWAARLPAERAAVMLRSASIIEARHGEIVDWLIRESGSTRVKAELEWQFVHAVTLEAASFPHRMEGRILPLDEAGKESRAYRQPLGVIGVISPWNFPMYLSHRSIGPALALGNAVVVKPAQDTPVTGGLLIAKIYEEAGLPPGLLNVVIGPSSEIGDPFTTHPIPRLISFTGSTPVGRHIGALAMQAPQLKRVALELGGNAPLVVLDDADLEHAVRSAVVGRFLHQGQVCMSANRIMGISRSLLTLLVGSSSRAILGVHRTSHQRKQLRGLLAAPLAGRRATIWRPPGAPGTAARLPGVTNACDRQVSQSRPLSARCRR